MKSKLAIFFILIILISACGQATSESADSASEYNPEINTQIAQALTSAATPTKQTLPTATATSTQTATPAPTQTPLPALTLTARPKTHATLMPYLTNVSGYSKCANSIYLKDITIKDGTALMPGEPFKKIWRLKNTGSCAWRPEYSLIFVDGYDMEGETTTINQYVAPGEEAKISVSLVAPEVEGTYTGYWILTDGMGKVFGETIFVQIVVSEDETEEEQE